MPFPISPANNLVTIVNGIEYVWNASKGAWYRYGDATVNIITANTFQALNGIVFSDGTIQTTTASSFTITGANYLDYGWVGQPLGPVAFDYGTL
jgi:hypothetical protein